MAFKIVVPEMGESIFEATVSQWLVKEGQPVRLGQAVVELETDKVNLEVSAEQAGVLVSIDRQAGEDVQIGDVLGLIEEAPGDGAAGATPAPKEKPAEKPAKEPESVPAAAAEQTPPPKTDERVTPMARRLAQEFEIDLAQVPTSGDRTTREDVEQFLAKQKAEPEAEPEPKSKSTKAEAKPAAAPLPAVNRSKGEERSRMTRRRQTIARRLVEAQQSAAMLTTFNEIDMSGVIDLRQRRRDSFQERHGVKLGFMSFFVKAVVGALKQFPRLNAEIDGQDIVLKHYYDIGMAIGAEVGLVVPVLREVERLTFAEIEQAIEAYVQKVKAGTLSVEDLRGGTFTITNGGVFGSLLSTPILNPPQVGILGLHKIEKRPVVVNDQIVIRSMMYVALSYDHRLVDGREAVQFLGRIKELIEEPETLLLEG